jgi:hypothetical protein
MTAAQDIRARQRWGCSHEEYLTLRCKPMRTFQAQRGKAGCRGIRWELTLWQWWTIWQDSSHWEHRGRGQGYVMCRRGDVGPYAIGNVFIATNIENLSNSASKVSDLPIGVVSTGKRYRAQREVDGKFYHLGLHETPELAHAAYLSLGPIGRPSITSIQFIGAHTDEATAVAPPSPRSQVAAVAHSFNSIPDIARRT